MKNINAEHPTTAAWLLALALCCLLAAARRALGQIQLPGPGIINSVAGDGIQGFSGDGGLATSAELNSPKGVTVDSSGNIYIADEGNSRLRKVAASTGDISTVAGNGSEGFSGDGGPATSARLSSPGGVTLDAAGNIYLADTGNNRIRVVNTGTKTVTIAKVTISPGDIATVAGDGINGSTGDGGPAISAELNGPIGIALDSSGNLYIADSLNNSIRKVTASTGVISRVAGDGFQAFSGDGGPATLAALSHPTGVALDTSANIYIADSGNARIRKVTVSTGNISTVAGGGKGPGCSDPTGVIGQNNCPATSPAVTIPNPFAVALDKAGDIFLTDSGLQSDSATDFYVREVTASTGLINIVAGDACNAPNGGGPICKWGLGDGHNATVAEVSPYGIAVDAAGNMYIADIGFHRIRAVGHP